MKNSDMQQQSTTHIEYERTTFSDKMAHNEKYKCNKIMLNSKHQQHAHFCMMSQYAIIQAIMELTLYWQYDNIIFISTSISGKLSFNINSYNVIATYKPKF